jgi:hypothetical protein
MKLGIELKIYVLEHYLLSISFLLITLDGPK